MNATKSERVASVTFRAIGANHRILATDPTTLDAARAIALDHLEQLDRAASRFREDSEVSRLAARPGPDPVWAVVSPLLASHLTVALAAARSTTGLLDPTVGGAAHAAGYDADLDVVRSRHGRRARVAPVPGWRTVQFDPGSRLLGVLPGTLLDLGATAKAHAADTIARELGDRLPGAFLVNLGGDIAVAGPPPEGGWRVGVEAAAGAVLQVVTTRDTALATSSTRLRRWRTTDGERHHIIDPRTGISARSTWAQVTCAASTAVGANTSSTAAIVLGAAAPAWLRSRGIAARLDGLDGSVVITPGWPSAMTAVAA